MKKYISIVALFFAGIFFGCSQNAMQEKRVSKIMNDLQQACQLTADEATKIKPMVQNLVTANMQNRQQYASDRNALKAANQTNRKNFLANLGTVISADRVKQYQDYVKQERQQKRGMGQGGGGEENEGSGSGQ